MRHDNVIVVGTGPTGLVTALGLARAGVDVTVPECEPSVVKSTRSRAKSRTPIRCTSGRTSSWRSRSSIYRGSRTRASAGARGSPAARPRTSTPVEPSTHRMMVVKSSSGPISLRV
jgi:glycine/D-amino acid oxidase-like deaminating enzyme